VNEDFQFGLRSPSYFFDLHKTQFAGKHHPVGADSLKSIYTGCVMSGCKRSGVQLKTGEPAADKMKNPCILNYQTIGF
jgi:hypothetical protein